MSILNLGLQGVALKRDQMSSESEALFDTANTLDDIRNKAQESNKLKSELKDPIQYFTITKDGPSLSAADADQEDEQAAASARRRPAQVAERARAGTRRAWRVPA